MSFLLGLVLVGAVVLLLAFLALLQRVADKTHDERHEMDAKLKISDAHLKAIEMARKALNDQQQHHAHMAETVMGMVATAHAHDTKMEQNDAAHQAKLQQMKNKPTGNK